MTQEELDGPIERLLNEDHNWHSAACVEAATHLQALAARVKLLEAENALLAAGACINPGQHGLVGDEHGNSYCTAFRALQDEEREHSEALARVAQLEARLEIDPAHPYDGIYARDETIRGLDAKIERLEERMGEAYQLAGQIADEYDGNGKIERLLDLLAGTE